MTFFKIYLNFRLTKHTMFLIQTLSLYVLSICTCVFFCQNSLSVHCETENVFSFEQESSTASCDLVPFYALHSLCSNFNLGFWCVYSYIASLEPSCNCKPIGSDCVWTSGYNTCLQLELKPHSADLDF